MKRHDAAQVLTALDEKVLPLTHIKDAINFTRKDESLALQLADACAWAFRHAFDRGTFKTDPYVLALEDATVWHSMTTLDAARRLA
jgi:Protein of unknown function (DUF3800)